VWTFFVSFDSPGAIAFLPLNYQEIFAYKAIPSGEEL
jgi:hypothetical protein